MKWIARCAALTLVGWILGIFAIDAAAQPAAGAPGQVPLIIRRISGGKVETPEYQVKKSQFAARTRNWFQIIVDYEVAPEWMDEATFTYYVLTQSRKPEPGRNPRTLFKGEVTYINIGRGKRRSDVYLHPSTVERFGEVERVAVEVRVGGAIVAREGIPQGTVQQRWWESFAPLEGYVLNRMQTPFAMLNFDDYEAIKPSR
ncbi:MAG: hypothetical protein NZ740_04570 [Kiritimatiellae bacterium]|nr:hypothetical protein [Kiritimatiellia bacterium]MDW8458365.1 hypothetical protein [Verrucomicrobiota bacterium]